ncbi:MAG: FAD-dependent oxidoreductase [Candidatus Aenigmarchaeota archaeon]|nr:FAD-dependent oxidoreductase [Candidatus Aenigmarchaeota archaeon]
MYDMIIIGAGPAGLTAALFAKRQGLDVVVLNNPEQLSNLAITHHVENWPGIEKTSGLELLNSIKKHVKKSGVKIIDDKAVSMTKNKGFIVKTEKSTYEARALILAMGLQHRKGNIEGEDRFFGKGVSYCIVCDGPLFNGRDVAVIGGGDAALKGALALREMGANNIYLIHRRNELRAEKALQDKLSENKIKIELESIAEEISGTNFVEAIKLKNLKTETSKKIKVDGIFIEVGSVPVVELVRDIGLELDNNGFIKTDCEKKTNIAGIFAAGDISTGQLKQDITASADGAIAAMSAYRYMRG